MRDWIRYRLNGLEPQRPVGVALHHAAAVRLLAIRILHIVVAGGVGFPDVDFDVGDRRAVDVFHRDQDEAGLAQGVVRDRVAVGERFGVVGVEGTEDGAFGAVGRFRVVDGVYEQGEAEDVREENEFLGQVNRVNRCCV